MARVCTEVKRFVRNINRTVYLILATLALAAATGTYAWGQALGARAQLAHPDGGAAPSFEVASVKPNLNREDVFSFSLQTARFRAMNAPLNRLIRFAYDVKSDRQVLNMPGWASSENFDIDAKISDADVEAMKKLTPDQRFEAYRLMVQSLLADRFQMKVSVRTEELPAYVLVVAKNGPRLSLAPEFQARQFPQLSFTAAGELKAASVSMAFFAGWLSGKLDTGDRVVVDSTGLNGRYDFSLHYDAVNKTAASMESNGNQAATAPGMIADKPPLVSAIQEQLGLKLEPRKAPVEVLVIDQVERPSPN